MATTLVRLGRLQFVTRDSQLLVTLTATAELSWWPAGSEVLGSTASAARVAELVRAGRLWIGCGGSSFGLVVHATLQRQNLILHRHDEAATAELVGNLTALIEGCPIWEELSLHIQPETDERRWQTGRQKDDASRLFFLVKHPASPRGLCAPNGVPQAQFRRVMCHMNFTLDPEGVNRVVIPSKQTTKLHSTKEGKVRRRRAGACRGKMRKIKTKQKSTAVRKGATHAARPVAQADSTGLKPLARDVFQDGHVWPKAVTLIDTSLHALVGLKRRALGVWPVVGAHFTPLLDVAPAVWNYHYFQAVSNRAAFVPHISKLLATFTGAQSAGLRRKIDAMERAGESTESMHPNVRVAQGMEAKLQQIVLKNVSSILLPKKRRPVKQPDEGIVATRQTAPGLQWQQDHLGATHGPYEIHQQNVVPQQYGVENNISRFTGFSAQPVASNDMYLYGPSFDTDEDLLGPEDENAECWHEVNNLDDISNWMPSSSDTVDEDDSWPDESYDDEDQSLAESCWQDVEDWQLEEWSSMPDSFDDQAENHLDNEDHGEYMDADVDVWGQWGERIWEVDFNAIEEW